MLASISLSTKTMFRSKDLFDVIGLVDYSIMFLCPDPVSIEKSNFFIKELFNYRLRNLELKYDLGFTVQNLKRTKKEILFTPRNLLLMLGKIAPKYSTAIANVVSDLNIGIVYNPVRSYSDKDTASIYQLIIRNSYGVDIDFIGELAYSDVIISSIANMKPVVTYEKNGELVEALDSIASNLSQRLYQKKGEYENRKDKTFYLL